MTLKELNVGKSGRVLAVGGEKVLRRRLLEMGITPKTVLTIKKAAPMGDPIELLLRGYVLALRLDDAEKITIEEIKLPSAYKEAAEGAAARMAALKSVATQKADMESAARKEGAESAARKEVAL